MNERWQEIERIYHEARELDASARAEYLAKACGEDESLRKEVGFLLAQADRAGSFLESPAIEVAAENMVNDAGPSRPTLELGTMIAHYRLTGKLGEGGMGEVYRARDTKLQRDVAIKILPQSMARDAQRMARFEREARTLASLNHPNIAAIHGIEESNGIRALVMELVEGETLAERISVAAVSPPPVGVPKRKAAGEDTGATTGERRSAMTTKDALPIARQIAEALEYAHERGVIHRDLKPANVKITPEGTVKVLDFGLAKVVNPQDSSEDPANSPTLSAMATQAGMILGTASYMSPEQANGQRVDRRCDIWAFGCVLYEMLSGRKAFGGETIQDVLVAVIINEPDWNALPETTPPSTQRLIRRCLQKDQRQRLQAIGDARIAIEETLGGTETVALGMTAADADQKVGATTVGHRPPLQSADHSSSDTQIIATLARRHKKTLLAALAAAIVVTAVLAYLFRPALPPPTLSGYTQLTSDAVEKALIGTDGSRLYLRDSSVGVVQMSVHGGSLAPIPSPAGLEGRLSLAGMSPDGSKLLVGQMRGLSGAPVPLWAVPTLGGSPVRLGNIEGDSGAWSPDGEKLVYLSGDTLYIANADGTGSRKLADLPGPDRNGAQDSTPPVWSPDGREIALNLFDPKTQIGRLWELSSNGKNLRQMFPGWHQREGDCCGSWTPDGKYFVFQSQGQIWAVREAGSFFEKVNRKPVELTAGTVSYSYPVPGKAGKKLFAVAGFRRGELERYDAGAKSFEPFLGGISAQDFSFSKNGEWVAYVTYPGGIVWRSKLDGNDKLQLSSPPVYAQHTAWSPDGSEIAFYGQQHGGPYRIYEVPASGGSPQQLMPNRSGNQADPSWSPNGNRLAFGGVPNVGTTAIHILDLKTHQVTTLQDSQGLFSPRWSPDGRYLVALPSDSSGLRLFDFKTQKWSVLVKGIAGYPCWSHDCRFVYFYFVQAGSIAVERVEVPGGKVQQAASMKGVETTGLYGFWFGLTPDNSPLTLKDVGSHEIVSMKWHEP